MTKDRVIKPIDFWASVGSVAEGKDDGGENLHAFEGESHLRSGIS